MGQPPSTIVVTGAAGFIGSHLAERLLAGGWRVIGVDCFDDYYDPALKRRNAALLAPHPRFSLEEVDLADAVACRALAARVEADVVAHLAGVAGVRLSVSDPSRYVRANVVATQNVLDGWGRGRARIVLASSSSVYGSSTPAPFREDAPAVAPPSPYAATKRAGELLAQVDHALHGTTVTALRLFSVYGPRQRPDLAIRRFATAIRAGEPVPVYGDGSMARDFTHVSDIVGGIVCAVDHPPPGYAVVNLGGATPVRVADLVARLGAALGRVPDVAHLPRPAGEMEATYADVRLAGELWGWAPRVSLDDGLAEFVAWLANEPRHAT